MNNPANPATRKPGNLKILFLGTPRLAQIVLEKLADSKYKPSLVITAPDRKSGRGQKLTPSPVKLTAQKLKIETSYQLPVTSYQFDLAILVAFGKIIPKEILNIPKFGFINIHPSLLPKFRGPSPVQTAILEREKESGVTIIKLDEEVDHGPILAQKKVDLKNTNTHESLIESFGKLGAELLTQTLPDYLSGKLKPKPQNHEKATFTEKITKQDGYINLTNKPDEKTLDAAIRAYYPWPGVWTKTKINGHEKLVKFLPGNKMQIEGKNPTLNTLI